MTVYGNSTPVDTIGIDQPTGQILTFPGNYTPGGNGVRASVSNAPSPDIPKTNAQIRKENECALKALAAGGTAALKDFFSPFGTDPTSDVGELLRDKNVQRAAFGAAIMVANSARTLAPAAARAADLIPVVGEAILVFQVGKALYVGGEGYVQSINRCLAAHP